MAVQVENIVPLQWQMPCIIELEQMQILESLPASSDERIETRRKAVQEEMELLKLAQLSCMFIQCSQETLGGRS